MSKLRVGDAAPDFALMGTLGIEAGHREYTLAQYRGQPVVLVFYPADNSPVCTVQLGNYNQQLGAFGESGAQVLALSPQSLASHDEFHRAHGPFSFPLLADVDKEVGGLYGILGPMGFYRRSIVVVSADGVVRYVHRSVTSLTYQRVPDIVAALGAHQR